MCRLLAYLGTPIVISKLIYDPKNSLIRQSFNAREIEEPLNGDGFGVGWYSKELSVEPAVFVSMSPAWSNRNLKSLASKIRSQSVFAHVRAASVGDISEANCHPFSFGCYLFMHNGSIGGFDKIKREIRRRLSDEIYNWVRGQTDSEHFFALILDKLQGKANGVPEMMQALKDTIDEVEALKAAVGNKEETYLNCVLGNGEHLIATRYVSDHTLEALSLYYSTGARYECRDGVCYMVKSDAEAGAALVVSEKLTDLREDWREVPKNHAVVVGIGGSVRLESLSV